MVCTITPKVILVNIKVAYVFIKNYTDVLDMLRLRIATPMMEGYN
jgi:hypothetical protein